MKERHNFIAFSLIFSIVLFMFYTTERYNEPISLPERRLDYASNIADNFDVSNIFKIDEVAEFASEMFDYQGIRSGIVDIATTGFTKEDLGVENAIINFTEIILEDGSRISFIEPESEVVDMYNKLTADGLLVVIVEDSQGAKHIIRADDENFQLYKQALLKEKRSIQTTKLTNLEMLLSEAHLVGSYDAFLGSQDHLIRTSKIYFNEKKNYMLMLSKDKVGVEYFLVDADVDMYFDHIYEFGTEFLEVKGYVTSNELEHLLYRSFIKMIDLDTLYFETKFKEDTLIIIRNEDTLDEE